MGYRDQDPCVKARKELAERGGYQVIDLTSPHDIWKTPDGKLWVYTVTGDIHEYKKGEKK